MGAAPAKVSDGRPFSGGSRLVFSELVAATPSRAGYVDSYTGFEKLVGCREVARVRRQVDGETAGRSHASNTLF